MPSFRFLHNCVNQDLGFDRGEARSPSSGSDRPRSANRGRQPTWSLVYDGNSNENTFASFFHRFPWFFRFELQSVPSSDSEDEVYSVQVLNRQ